MAASIRVMVFIDGSNLHWSRRSYNIEHQTDLKIAYEKLLPLLVGERRLVRPIYYCSTPVPPTDPSQVRFLDYLRHIGIQVIEKKLKTRTDPLTGAARSVEKGVDVALATDLLGMAWEDAYDVAILVSGDSDYVGAVSRVMSKGKNVEVVSFKAALSRELREAVLKVTFIDDVVNLVRAEK